MEVWLPVEDLLVSNIGRIKNKKGIILRPGVCKRSGYVPTVFRINENKPYVNHINGIKHDNQAVNLEWVTPKENAECKVFPNHGRGNSRWTIQKALDEEVIQIWNSICLTGNTLKIAENSISECCSGKRNTATNGAITQGSLYEGYFRFNQCYIHCLVALAFCSKEEGKDCVNHIDALDEEVIQIWNSICLTGNTLKIAENSISECCSGKRNTATNGAITQGSLYEGYFRFNQCYIHCLVALAFCSKEEGKDCVNHIDGNRTNNKASNLEWCTQKENTQHAVYLKLWVTVANSKDCVNHIDALGHCRKQIWNSICLAGNTLKIAENSISECCSGKRNTAGGWCWIYYENYIPQDPNEEWREIEYKLRKFKVSSLGRIRLTNALAFCSKEEGKDCVNHIDALGHCRKHAIKQIFDDGSFREFPSLAEAQRMTGIKSQNIGLVCRGLQAHAGGYRWEYVSTISHNNHDFSQ
ncbi:20281_t:CDS:2 [Entrophospora sp. SA101]|nr:20281_t:CDS:2 [Entrophospora sp. SA101]